MEQNKNIFDRLDDLHDRYVPGSGPADTVGGELLRATERLVYRYYNDGDKVGEGYGNETCNSSYRYLYRHADNIPVLGNCSDQEYEDRLKELVTTALELLDSHPDLFKEHNSEDSRKPEPEDLQYEDYEDYEDEGYEDEDEDYD